jgi:hypothetical protein
MIATGGMSGPLIGAPVRTSFFDALMSASVLSMEGAIC